MAANMVVGEDQTLTAEGARYESSELGKQRAIQGF